MAIDAGTIDSFLKAVRAHIEGAGGQIIATGRDAGTGPDIGSGASAEAHAGDPAVIQSALQAMGNPFDYDAWVKMCAAVKTTLNLPRTQAMQKKLLYTLSICTI